MKVIKLISSVILLFTVICLSCDENSSFVSTEGIEEPVYNSISGNSFLKVSNECSECGDVYFNGKLIGTVDVDCCSMWGVPEGLHSVKIYGDYKASCGGKYEFTEGEVTIVCFKPNEEIGSPPDYKHSKGENHKELIDK